MYPHHLHTPDRPVCCNTIAAQRQHKHVVELILLYSELRHDIDADILRVERQRHLEETPVISNNDTDSYIIKRYIDNAVNKVVSRCQAYLLLPSPYVRRISTDHTHSWEEKNIMLALPHNWPPHNIDALRDACHNFIVKSVEYMLLSSALPHDAYTALCKQQADDFYDDINVNINARLHASLIQPTFLG